MTEWNYLGAVYEGCSETPDWSGHDWCYVQGGPNCAVAENSSVDGEDRKWQECSNAVITVTGSFVQTVSDPETFVSDDKAKEGVQKAVAEEIGVQPEHVEVTLTLVDGRRLLGRNLADQQVQVDYTITVPSTSVDTDQFGADLVSTVAAIDTTALADAIEQEVVNLGGSTYTVSISDFTPPDAPVIATITFTATATTTTATVTNVASDNSNSNSGSSGDSGDASDNSNSNSGSSGDSGEEGLDPVIIIVIIVIVVVAVLVIGAFVLCGRKNQKDKPVIKPGEPGSDANLEEGQASPGNPNLEEDKASPGTSPENANLEEGQAQPPAQPEIPDVAQLATDELPLDELPEPHVTYEEMEPSASKASCGSLLCMQENICEARV